MTAKAFDGYILFSFPNYYPSGGWSDLTGIYRSLKLAFEAADRANEDGPIDNQQIICPDLSMYIRSGFDDEPLSEWQLAKRSRYGYLIPKDDKE